MLKIRLMRIGAKKKPFYRVVAMHERSKRTGGYLELLGTYNPLTEPKDIKLNKERIDYWIKKGAQPSVGYLRIIGKAPQRLPRKAKKPARDASQSDAGGEAKKEEAPVAPAPQDATPKEEATPVEEAKPETAEPTPVEEEKSATAEPTTDEQAPAEAPEATTEESAGPAETTEPEKPEEKA